MQSERQVYLDYLARCEQAFRPFSPIELPEFFKGRENRIALLTSELATTGRQVAIYGERGVGKTSLALLAYYFANYSDEETYLVRCERASTYDRIFGQFLAGAGEGHLPAELEHETSGRAGLGLWPVSLSGRRTSRTRHVSLESARSISPALLLKVFAARKGLLIIDEYDRVQDSSTHTRLAETLKHFSDAGSQTKIIVVGVAESLSALIGEHQSLTRCLAQIKLDRMTPNELGEILSAGENRAGVVFGESIRRRIIALSDGFPFYTHLLGKYCAEDAGKVLLSNPDAHVVAAESEYRRALRRAIENAEHSLREDYEAAVITIKRKTDMFKYVLWGIAFSESKEVQVQEIAQNIALFSRAKPKTQSLGNYLGPLTRQEKRAVLTRVRQGFYKFTNPLMRAYVRLILEEHNLVTAGQQLEFPWMR